ncbi:MAG: endonuclease/exonuclease/phosphatase family protein [Oscillospiraceae bacterium]
MKKALKIGGGIIGAVLLLLLGYVIYVFAAYDRIEDNQELSVQAGSDAKSSVPTGTPLNITSWNIGFGAYTDDYSFFMDGGEYSRGFSEDIVGETVEKMASDLAEMDSDFYLVQEVDVDATRSYHINEYDIITRPFSSMSKVYAQNYDSPYLFYPILEPHGKSVAGIVTMSDYSITSSLRRSLPIQSGFAKFLDLDRCYSISRIPADNGKELILINFHLSAYTTDPTVAESQLKMLYSDITAEYEKGNYVICGGDFNKDLLRDSGLYSSFRGRDYRLGLSLFLMTRCRKVSVIAPYNEDNPVASCRNADKPWDPSTNFQLTIDGFIISDNVQCVQSDVIDKQFACSDHNPVYMNFILK